jgi:hypothetical protein
LTPRAAPRGSAISAGRVIIATASVSRFSLSFAFVIASILVAQILPSARNGTTRSRVGGQQWPPRLLVREWNYLPG